MKLWSIFLIFALLSAPVLSDDIAQECKDIIDYLFSSLIPQFVRRNQLLEAAWEMYVCLQDFEIIDDLKAICNIVGRVVPNVTHLHMYGNYFVQEQAFSLCQYCDKAEAGFEGLSATDLGVGIEWAASRVSDPNIAAAIRQEGPGFVNRFIQDAFPGNLCNYVKKFCDKAPPKLIDTLRSAFENITHCVECNLCENAILYAEMDILPNPSLPDCIVQEVEEKFCVLLNKTIPIINMNGYDLCVKGINSTVTNLVGAMKTYVHPTFLCGSLLKVCDVNHTDNMIECVCDNVEFPNYLEWILPCRWQRQNP